MYAGDFPTASSAAGTLIKEEPEVDTAYLPMAMAAIATGDTTRGRAAYQQAVSAGDPGVSLAAIGLADVAMYEGRYGEVIDALSAALERDAAQGNTVGEVAKLVALAEAYAALGRDEPSHAAIAKARALSNQDNALVSAARLAVAAAASTSRGGSLRISRHAWRRGAARMRS